MTIESLGASLSDRYRIERELGQGGMATVYLAHDLKHDRQVAVKVLRPELAAVIGAERFLAEIKTTANLQHPHILPLHDSGEVNGTVFYVMPFVKGESLRDRLVREKQLPVADAVRIASEVAAALDYAHRHNVIHRDIKPENILLHDGSALVADFGIALAASRTDGSSRMTETGMSLGTPHYMSPEQAMGERDLDARTDVYAVGCVLFEMLSGEPPFTGPTPQAIVAKVMTTAPTQLSDLRSTVPMHVAEAVHTALQKLPADRFATAGELVAALKDTGYGRARAGQGSAATLLRSNRPAMLLGGIALLTSVAALWGWLRPSAPVSREVVRFQRSITAGNLGDFGSRLALSRDGRFLAYIAPGERNLLSLFVHEVDQLEPVVMLTEGGWAAAFSPDAQSLAIVNAESQLQILPRGGAAARTVHEGVDQTGGLEWGADGFLYFIPIGGGQGVWRVSEDGGEAGQVVANDTLQAEVTGFNRPLFPALLPGGKGLLVTFYRGPGVESDIAVVNLETGVVSYLVKGAAARYTSGYLLYATAAGILMAAPFDPGALTMQGPSRSTGITVAGGTEGWAAFAASETGTLVYAPPTAGRSLLAWVNRDGSEQVVNTELWRNFNGVALSADGGRIAMGINDPGKSAIWTYDLAQQTVSRLTFDGTLVWRPLWSPDGSEVAYASDRGNQAKLRAIWIQRSDGSGQPRLLVGSERHAQEVTWSADGSSIAFREGFTDGTTNRDIFVFQVGNDTTRHPFVATPADEQNPKLSPNGKWLAYNSNQSGSYEIYVQPFPEGAGRWQVSSGGGSEPLWSRDGTELFYRDPEQNLVAVPVLPGATFATGPRRTLFSALRYYSDGNATTYDITPDGRRFLMIKRPVDQELVVVINWIEELKAQAGR